MKTYNTYAEAKIANPESVIVTLSNTSSALHGKFEVKDSEPGVSHILHPEGGWHICYPEDYCMTVEKFLADGHKFVDGDLYIGKDGKVKIVGHDFPARMANSYSTDDNERLVLRAAALEQTETPEEKEAFDAMAQDNEAVEVKLVTEWNSGDVCLYNEEKCFFVGPLPVEGTPLSGDCVLQHKGGAPLVARTSDLRALNDNPEQPKPKHTKEEYVRIEDDFFDLKDDFRDRKIYFNNGTNEDHKYQFVMDIIELSHHYSNRNLFRKVVTELTEREAFTKAYCSLADNESIFAKEWAEKLFDAGCRFNSNPVEGE